MITREYAKFLARELHNLGYTYKDFDLIQQDYYLSFKDVIIVLGELLVLE